MNNYKLFLMAYIFSSVGDWFFKLTLPIYLFNLTGSALHMSIGYALGFLPFILFTLVGGILADIYSRKTLLISLNLFSSVTISIIGILTYVNHNIIIIYLLTFILSSITTIIHPVLQSFLPDIVSDKYQLATKNSFVLSTDNTLSILAPFFSGVLISLFGVHLAFFIAVLAFLIALMLLIFIKVTNTSLTINKNLNSIKLLLIEGLETVKLQPFLLYGALLFFGTNFAIHFFNVNFIYFLKEYLTATPTMIGIAFAITGIGALLGTFSAPLILKRFQENYIIIAMTILGGLFMYTLALANSYWMLGILWGIVSFFGSINVVSFFTLRQKVVPANILGRSVAITRMIAYASIPIASILGGLTLDISHSMLLIVVLAATLRTLIGIIAIYTPLFKSHANH